MKSFLVVLSTALAAWLVFSVLLPGKDSVVPATLPEFDAATTADRHGVLLSRLAPLDSPVPGGEAVLNRFSGATDWLNSPRLSAVDLRGKVVLVDFWTYTCINWIRTLPYVRAWAHKYADQGLVVIGVHTPEFEFEKNLDNVRLAVQEMIVGHPVAIDSNYAIWRAFGNNAWPARYLIDAEGRVRHRQIGEGGYERDEKMIQELLAEVGRAPSGGELVVVEGRGAEAAADWNNLRSPETYLGTDRIENFVSPGGAVIGKLRTYAAPTRLAVNRWALAGDWTMHRHAALLDKPNGRISYRFHARDVHLVMGPGTPGKALRFRVLIDGKPPGAAHGIDIDAQGNGTVVEQRLYQLIRQSQPIVDRRLEIEFLDPAAEVFAFTFG